MTVGQLYHLLEGLPADMSVFQRSGVDHPSGNIPYWLDTMSIKVREIEYDTGYVDKFGDIVYEKRKVLTFDYE